MRETRFAPKEVFDQLLEWMPIPTIDLVLEYGDQGVIIVRRKIKPYQNKWALPGLRQLKGERYVDTLKRIAQQEVGLRIDPTQAIILGKYDGFFKTEHQRQDSSTGYLVKVSAEQPIKLNTQHFSSYRLTREIPENTGAMYKFYLGEYSKLGN